MSDKVDIYIPIYIGDYMADTADLNAEEHGAYLMILMAMWRARAPLPLARLDRVAKVAASRWDEVWGVIGRFFTVVGETVTQGRLMRELEASLDKKRRASDAGRAGGRASAQARVERASTDAQATVEQPSTTASTDVVANGKAKSKPSTSPSEDLCLGSSSVPPYQPPDQTRPLARSESWAKLLPTPAIPPRPRIAHVGAATKLFLACFEAYPRKDAMQPAAQVWQDIALGYPGGELALHDAIMRRFDGGMLLRPPYHGPNGKRPYFETFLLERRWEDPDSAPDDIAPVKPAETLPQRDERARREAAERRAAEKAELDRKTREADAAVAMRLASAGGAA